MDLKALVDGYERNVRTLDQALTELEQRSENLRTEIADHEAERGASRASLDALRRTQASLQSERESLMGQHAEASFTQDAGELQRISRRRVALDKEMEQVERRIRESRTVETKDFDEQAAALQVAKDLLEERLPKQFYNTTTFLNPLLEAIAGVLKDDSDRLRKRFNAVQVPAVYSKATIERVRLDKDPSYKSKQAHERKQAEKEAERKAKMGDWSNTDAYANAHPRKRKPQPTVSLTSGDSDTGTLSGAQVRRILREKQGA